MPFLSLSFFFFFLLFKCFVKVFKFAEWLRDAQLGF